MAETNTCEICYDRQMNISLLPCKHQMCIQCAYKWTVEKGNFTCPQCRQSIPHDTITDDVTTNNNILTKGPLCCVIAAIVITIIFFIIYLIQ